MEFLVKCLSVYWEEGLAKGVRGERLYKKEKPGHSMKLCLVS